MAVITIKTNGQTLIVHSSSVTLDSASEAAGAAVTLPATITTDTTYYTASAATSCALVIKSLDGTTIATPTLVCAPGVVYTLNPKPDLYQLAADSATDGAYWRPSSYYYVSNGVVQSSGAVAVDTLFLVPCLVPNDVTLTKIGGYVSGAGGANSVIRFGIYSGDGSGGVGSLLLDCGTIDGTSATVQEITISQAVPQGLHWFGVATQVGTAPSMDRDTTSANVIPFPYRTTIPTTTLKPLCVTQASVTGALPGTLSAPASSAAFPPRIFVKA